MTAVMDALGPYVAIVTYAAVVLGFGYLVALAGVTLICGEEKR